MKRVKIKIFFSGVVFFFLKEFLFSYENTKRTKTNEHEINNESGAQRRMHNDINQ